MFSTRDLEKPFKHLVFVLLGMAALFGAVSALTVFYVLKYFLGQTI